MVKASQCRMVRAQNSLTDPKCLVIEPFRCAELPREFAENTGGIKRPHHLDAARAKRGARQISSSRVELPGLSNPAAPHTDRAQSDQAAQLPARGHVAAFRAMPLS